MARVSNQYRIAVRLGGPPEDDPVLIIRRPTDDEIHDFYNARFEGARGTPRYSQARAEFVDRILLDVQNVEVEIEPGRFVPLTPAIPGWKGWIDAGWKSSVAAMYEEKQTVTKAAEKNSGGPSAS